MSNAPLMLSVSGLRGLIGQSLTPSVAARFGAAFGSWLTAQKRAGGSTGAPHVVLGRDSRPSGQLVECAAVSGLLSVGCRVTTLGIVTTPTTAIMTEHLHADGGMVITASHNPIIWNGIKCLRHDGVAPPPEEANEIIRRFKSDDVQFVPVEALKSASHNADANRVHLDRVLPQVDVAAIRKAKLKCVVDSVHGAGGAAAALLLRELGVELVHLYAEPTGLFPHTPEPLRENLTELAAAVKKHGAHVGFAQDPDADRLALVDDRGEYIGEEYTLALTVEHVLKRGTKGPSDRATKGSRHVAANLSTSRMLDDIAAKHGAIVHRTAVGEANVAAAMRRHGAIIGGEGNGGVILPPVTFVRDSITGMALVLEMLATRGKALSTIVGEIPRYAIVKDKVAFDAAVASRLVPALKETFASQKIDLQDGVRIDWPDRWVHVRPSNTEPIMRLIAEAPRDEDAKAIIAQVRAALGLK